MFTCDFSTWSLCIFNILMENVKNVFFFFHVLHINVSHFTWADFHEFITNFSVIRQISVQYSWSTRTVRWRPGNEYLRQQKFSCSFLRSILGCFVDADRAKKWRRIQAAFTPAAGLWVSPAPGPSEVLPRSRMRSAAAAGLVSDQKSPSSRLHPLHHHDGNPRPRSCAAFWPARRPWAFPRLPGDTAAAPPSVGVPVSFEEQVTSLSDAEDVSAEKGAEMLCVMFVFARGALRGAVWLCLRCISGY